jgi:hypothetical protein
VWKLAKLNGIWTFTLLWDFPNYNDAEDVLGVTLGPSGTLLWGEFGRRRI